MLLSNKDQTTTLGLIFTARKYVTILKALLKNLGEDKKKEREDVERELVFAQALLLRSQGMEARLMKKIKINPFPAQKPEPAPGEPEDKKQEAESNNDEE